MKKILLLFIVFIILFSSCVKEDNHKLPRVIVPKIDNSIEVDNEEMINVHGFLPLGFNFSENIKVTELRHRFDSIRVHRVPFDSIISRKDLKVIIDTSYNLYCNSIVHKPIPRPKNVVTNGLIDNKIPTEEDYKNTETKWNEYFNITSKLEEESVICYSLLIYNNSNEDVLLDYELIQEAKDIDGKWKPIEYTFEYEMCGTGKLRKPFLDVKKYFLLPIIKYKGSFKTKIRIKFKNFNHIYYSNEINGTINRSQFSQDFVNDFLESYGDNLEREYFEEYKKEMFLKKI